MNIKSHIPNALTCGNLFCGCLALVKAFEGNLVWAAYLVGIALVLDFFDGFTARLLKVSSPIGKDLDSLADVVTFGVVPGIVMFQMIHLSIYDDIYRISMFDPEHLRPANLYPYNFFYKILPYFAFMIPIFSAIRLAKFNNDTRQSDSFIGLPTPANAMFILSLPLILNIYGHEWIETLLTEAGKIDGMTNIDRSSFLNIISFKGILNPYILCLVSCILSLLLVAPLPLIALKFKNFGWAGNEMRFILIGLSFVCLAAFQFVGIPLVIILYILLSIVNNIFFKKKV